MSIINSCLKYSFETSKIKFNLEDLLVQDDDGLETLKKLTKIFAIDKTSVEIRVQIDVCRNSVSCDNKCGNLHICEHQIKGKDGCKRVCCKFEHTLSTEHNRRALELEGLDVDFELLIKVFRIYYSASSNRMPANWAATRAKSITLSVVEIDLPQEFWTYEKIDMLFLLFGNSQLTGGGRIVLKDSFYDKFASKAFICYESRDVAEKVANKKEIKYRNYMFFVRMGTLEAYQAARELVKKVRLQCAEKKTLTVVRKEEKTVESTNRIKITSSGALTIEKVRSHFLFAEKEILGIDIDTNTAVLRFTSPEIAESMSHVVFDGLTLELFSGDKTRAQAKPVVVYEPKPEDIVFTHKDNFLLSIILDTHFSSLNSVLLNELKSSYSIVEHNPDDITVRCTLHTGLVNYNSLAKNWNKTINALIKKFIEEFDFVKLPVEEYDADAVKNEIRKFNQKRGFHIGFRMTKLNIIVFGKTKMLKEFFDAFKKDANSKTKSIEFDVPKLDDAENYSLVQPLITKLKDMLKDIRLVEYETETQRITLNASLKQIEKIKVTILHCINKIRCEKLKALSEDSLSCSNLIDILEGIAKEKQLLCRFKKTGELIYFNDCPQINSPATSTLDEIERQISSNYKQVKIDFFKDTDIVEDEKWMDFKLKNLRRNVDIGFEFIDSKEANYLAIFGRTEAAEELEGKLKLFLHENKLVTKVLEMKQEDVIFLKSVSSDELTRIENERKVKFNFVPTSSVNSNELSNNIQYEMKISNCAEAVFTETLNQLRNIASNKKMLNFEVKELPGLAKLLNVNNANFKHDLKKLQSDNKSHISYEASLYDHQFNKPIAKDADSDDDNDPSSVVKVPFGKATLILRKGDLVKVQADVIVNSCPKNLNLKCGILSRLILNAAGNEIQAELKEKYPNGIVDFNVGTTKSGTMKNCKSVYHVVCSSFNDDATDVSLKYLETLVQNCLNQMKVDKFKNIALPAIGCGNLDFPPRVAAHVMLETCVQFLKEHQNVNYKVNIVLFDDEIYDEFIGKIDKMQIVQKAESTVTVKRAAAVFTVISDSYWHDLEFKTRHIINDYIITEKIDHDTAKQLKPEKLAGVLKITSDIEVLRGEDGTISLTGYKDDVKEMKEKLNDLIIKHCENKNKEYQKMIKAKSQVSSAQWEFNIHSDKWTPFSFAISSLIEEAFEKKDANVSFTNEDGDDATCDLQAMTYTVDNNESYAMRRTESPKFDCSYPDTWEWPKSSESDYDLVSVDKKTAEYKSVESDFLVKMATLNVNVTAIERIQNKRLYQSYLIHKEYVKKNNNNNENEKLLYHGTDEKNITNICRKGFNRSYCGINGVVYGQGAYFAVASKYSHSYTGDGKGSFSSATILRKMFRARVLVGASTIGNSSMKTAPLKVSGEQFDSTKDTNDSIFVCYHDNQCYPEYLITYISF